jgi:hypothetical protein
VFLEERMTQAPRPRGSATAGRPDDRWPIALIIAFPLAITAWGFAYYAAPPGGRVRSPLHALLKPSGSVGLALGVVAFLLFLFLWLYPLRKSVRWLAWTGAVGAWLRIHILAGIAIPLLAAVHAGWRFDGLIGLGYASMLLVALSGVVGRYLYVRIPRSKSGLELSREEVANERRTLITEIAVTTGEDPIAVERILSPAAASGATPQGPLATLGRLVRDDWERRATLRRLRRRWSQAAPNGARLDRRTVSSLLGLARRELGLAQQLQALEATRRVFALWHVVHRPFAILALLAVVVHVVVAIAIGGVSFAGVLPR